MASWKASGFHWKGELLALGIGTARRAAGMCYAPKRWLMTGMLDVSILPMPCRKWSAPA